MPYLLAPGPPRQRRQGLLRAPENETPSRGPRPNQESFISAPEAGQSDLRFRPLARFQGRAPAEEVRAQPEQAPQPLEPDFAEFPGQSRGARDVRRGADFPAVRAHIRDEVQAHFPGQGQSLLQVLQRPRKANRIQHIECNEEPAPPQTAADPQRVLQGRAERVGTGFRQRPEGAAQSELLDGAVDLQTRRFESTARLHQEPHRQP